MLPVMLFSMGIFSGYKLWDGLTLIMKLALHKPFFVGELISLATSPFEGDQIVGFVEHVTLSYLVLRDFQSFQVWVPLLELNRLSLKNWSRRAWKAVELRFAVSGRCDPVAVDALAKFGLEWISRSPDVLPKSYSKCCVKSLKGAYGLNHLQAHCNKKKE